MTPRSPLEGQRAPPTQSSRGPASAAHGAPEAGRRAVVGLVSLSLPPSRSPHVARCGTRPVLAHVRWRPPRATQSRSRAARAARALSGPQVRPGACGELRGRRSVRRAGADPPALSLQNTSQDSAKAPVRGAARRGAARRGRKPARRPARERQRRGSARQEEPLAAAGLHPAAAARRRAPPSARPPPCSCSCSWENGDRCCVRPRTRKCAQRRPLPPPPPPPRPAGA